MEAVKCRPAPAEHWCSMKSPRTHGKIIKNWKLSVKKIKSEQAIQKVNMYITGISKSENETEGRNS